LSDSQARVQSLERTGDREAERAAEAHYTELKRLEDELDAVQKREKKLVDGQSYQAAAIAELERENQRLRTTSNATRCQDSTSATSTMTPCNACPDLGRRLLEEEHKAQKLETANAALIAAKANIDSKLLHLTNQHAALERSSSRQLSELQEALEEAKESEGYLRLEKDDMAEAHTAEIDILQKELRLAEAEKGEAVQRLAAATQESEALQEEVQELERCNEALKAELDVSGHTTASAQFDRLLMSADADRCMLRAARLPL
jgi:chromosome segregation ATPase